jgi:hypothetical protein
VTPHIGSKGSLPASVSPAARDGLGFLSKVGSPIVVDDCCEPPPYERFEGFPFRLYQHRPRLFWSTQMVLRFSRGFD